MIILYIQLLFYYNTVEIERNLRRPKIIITVNIYTNNE